MTIVEKRGSKYDQVGKVVNKVVESGRKWDLYLYQHPDSKQLKVINVIGTYECKADAKGRVMVPAALKKQLKNVMSDGFVIKRSVFNQCLEIHPISEWNKVVEQVNKLNRFVKKNNDFISSYMSGLKGVAVDAAGRFLIAKDL